ncbi:hypothetical protein TNCV_797641 [Trichonephila clavipes]|nr:hypothetical protein TNCV_797641 [Trichonephila clavipes]
MQNNMISENIGRFDTEQLARSPSELSRLAFLCTPQVALIALLEQSRLPEYNNNSSLTTMASNNELPTDMDYQKCFSPTLWKINPGTTDRTNLMC